VLLDLMLPHVDGLEVCRLIRSSDATAAIPIIMVTARAEESERIVGLELGADDYLAKPFSPNEAGRARARAARRAQRGSARAAPGTNAKPLAYGPIALDTDRHVVSSGGRDVTLTAKEFLLLEYLLQHRGRVLSRDVLLTDVWGYRYTGGTRTVDVHVRRLREKLPVLVDGLVTVKQFGYKLVDPAP
jgi:DNA-binding response OmpR family regulator